jgi:tRNA(Ile)-lysidine synthase
LERALNPSVRESLAGAAEIARAEEDYWQAEVGKLLSEIWDASQNRLKITQLRQLPLAMQRRMIRAAADTLELRLEFARVEEILDVLLGSEKSANLPVGWRVARRKNYLIFCSQPGGDKATGDYEYCLSIPGCVSVPEAGVRFEATLVRTSEKAEYNRGNSLDPAKLSGNVQVRNWRAGDRFIPAHSKSPKKIKELLQKQHVTGTERRPWPVVASGDEVIWLRGYGVAAKWQPPDDAAEALMIKEFPLNA